MGNISNALRTLALRGAEIYLKICTVDEVYEDKRTIDCTPLDEGAPVLGVNLQADQSIEYGVVSFPAKGSAVVVGFLSPAVAVVLLTTEIEKTVLAIGETEVTVESDNVTLINSNLSITATADKLNIDADGTTLEMKKNLTTWNGGSETTANASDLKAQLQKVTARIDMIIQAISSAPVAPMDGGATYKAGMAGMLAGLQKEDYSNIIDDKIKH